MSTSLTTQAPTSKDQALRALGADCRSARRAAAPYLDFSTVAEGHRLLNLAEPLNDILIGVTGSICLIGDDATITRHGPFVIDRWAASVDDVSRFEITATSALRLLRVSWQYRSVVFEALPQLRQLVRETEAAVSDETNDLLVTRVS